MLSLMFQNHVTPQHGLFKKNQQDLDTLGAKVELGYNLHSK